MKDHIFSSEADFEMFFDSYKEQVYSYVLTIVKFPESAEELTQDIFIKLWTCRDILHEIKNIDNYIFILCRNSALNYLRKVKSDERVYTELRNYATGQHNQLEEYLLDRDYEKLLSVALSSLSPQRQTVYRLSREEGLSINEIAERLGLSPNTVKNHLVSSLQGLRIFLEKHGGISFVLTVFLSI